MTSNDSQAIENRCLISTNVENDVQRAEVIDRLNDLEVGFVSDPGGKKENQDCCGFATSWDGCQVFCVADGLGGHAGGRTASQIAINTIVDFVRTQDFHFEKPETLIDAFHIVNESIIQKQKEIPELASMRTTLVVLIVKDSIALWAHVGDVRLYLFRNEKIVVQTKDHSVPQMLVDTGEIEVSEIRNHPDRSRLLNALGSKNNKLKVSISPVYYQLEKNDCFQLSTDGYWEWIDESQMLQFLSNQQEIRLINQEMEAVVRASAQSQEPEHDNYTFMSVKVMQAELNKHHWNKTRFIKV